jgi:hypothetical protein
MAVSYNPSIVKSGLVLCLDAANKKSYSQNEFINTTDLFAWSGAGANAATLSRDTISSPVGNTPLRMAVSGNDPYWNAYNSSGFNIAPAANGQTWIVSVYVRANVATSGQIFIFNANSAGSGFANNDFGATGVSIGTEWTRVHYVRTMNSVNTAFIQVRLDGPDSGGAGQTVWWDGLQVERVPSGTTTPTPYTSIYSGGSVFRDLSGNDNTGTLTNYPTYNGSNNGSISFDGVNDFVTCGDRESFKVGSQLTLEGFFNINSYVNWGGIIGKSNSVKGVYAMHLSPSAARIRFSYNSVTPWTTNVVDGNYALVANQWVHSVITYDGTNLNFYINGALDKTQNIGVISFDTAAGYPVSLGQDPPGTNEFFNGRISKVSIYNRALTAAEVSQNFNALRGRYGL